MEDEADFVPDYLEEESDQDQDQEDFWKDFVVLDSISDEEESEECRTAKKPKLDVVVVEESSSDTRKVILETPVSGAAKKYEEAAFKKKRSLDRRLQWCQDCEVSTVHLKPHIAQEHILPRFPFILPLLVCWTCGVYSPKSHVRDHGPFDAHLHGDRYVAAVTRFLEFVLGRLCIYLQDLITTVVQNGLVRSDSTFTNAEVIALDLYDHRTGEPYSASRKASQPSRFSDLLHCRTILNILNFCDKKLPAAPAPVKKSVASSSKGSSSQATTTAEKIGVPSTVAKPVQSIPVVKPDRKRPRKSSVRLPDEDRAPYRFFDTHCHLDRLFRWTGHHGSLRQYMDDHQRYRSSMFQGCVTIFCDPDVFLERTPLLERIVKEEGVYAAIGCHPKKANQFSARVEEAMITFLQREEFVAVGEMGLDFSDHRLSTKDHQRQRDVLRIQLGIAVRVRKPIIIHTRDAGLECYRIVKEVVPEDTHIHLHCCIQKWEDILPWIRHFHNCFIGVTAACTDPSNQVAQEVARIVPLRRMVMETDSPYFKPHGCPRRIKHCDPQMVLQVARYLAKAQKVSLAEVLQICDDNARSLFNLQ